MYRIAFLFLALAAAVSACGRTPAEPHARAESTSQTNTSAGDSANARGGNLMGSGH